MDRFDTISLHSENQRPIDDEEICLLQDYTFSDNKSEKYYPKSIDMLLEIQSQGSQRSRGSQISSHSRKIIKQEQKKRKDAEKAKEIAERER